MEILIIIVLFFFLCASLFVNYKFGTMLVQIEDNLQDFSEFVPKRYEEIYDFVYKSNILYLDDRVKKFLFELDLLKDEINKKIDNITSSEFYSLIDKEKNKALSTNDLVIDEFEEQDGQKEKKEKNKGKVKAIFW